MATDTVTLPGLIEDAPVPLGDFSLYWFQDGALDELRSGILQRYLAQVLCMPTGSGKTVTAGELTQAARIKGSRVIFLVDRQNLVWQTDLRFREMGIPHGVIQAQNTFGRYELVQVASAQTLERWEAWPDFDLMIVDECHELRKSTAAVIASAIARGKVVIGLSATPFTKGLGDVYQRVVNAVTTLDLLNTTNPRTGRPYLAPVKVYSSPKLIDMKGAKTRNDGEWQDREAERRGSVIIGDAVSEWFEKVTEHYGGPVKTLVRSATIDHGAEICRAFQAAGFDFRQGHHRMTDAESRELVEAFRRGEFLGLVSVSKFERGFDVPDILCLVDQRPLRKSLAAEVQFLGRGMRDAPGKDACLVLDHTGNYVGFLEAIWSFWEEGVTALSQEKHRDAMRKEPSPREPVVCECGFVLPPRTDVCPVCGKERIRYSGVQYEPGELREVKREPGRRAWTLPKQYTWHQMLAVALELKHGDAEAAKKMVLAQYRELFQEWPPTHGGTSPTTT